MGAAARDEDRRRPHPAVTAVLLAVVGSVLLLFPLALYANAMALADGYRASHGQAGTPGTATVLDVAAARQERVCTGVFVPDGGGPAVEVRIEVPGRCEAGQEVEARLMEGRPSIFTGYDRPRAWAEGADGWGAYVVLVVLFGLLSLPIALLAAALAAKSAKAVAKRLGRPHGPPTL